MITLRVLLLLCAAALFTGCTNLNANKVKTFIATIPAIDMERAEHDFKSPLFATNQTVTDVKVEDGSIRIKSASSSMNIPLSGISDSVTFSNLRVRPTAAQLAAAERIKAAAATTAIDTKP